MPRAGLDARTVTEAASVIVDADGPAALTLARLATRLGVTPPSIYKHIHGLDDLTLRVSTQTIRRLADDLTTAALGRSGRDALLAIAAAYRSFANAHPGLYSLANAPLKPGSTAIQTEAARVVEVLGAVVRGYDVPEHLLVHAIRMVRVGLHGFVDLETRESFQMPYSVDESFLILVDALDASLRRLERGRQSAERNGKA